MFARLVFVDLFFFVCFVLFCACFFVFAPSEHEAYVVSYRDTRDRGGKVIYNLLLLGLGITLQYMEAGLSLDLGEVVVVKVRGL